MHNINIILSLLIYFYGIIRDKFSTNVYFVFYHIQKKMH